MKHAHSPKQAGFSLVELMIVLVIVGLVSGGVLIGGDLIRSYQLKSIISELGEYQTMTSRFAEKFLALPGDMPYAEDFWGEVDADPTTCRTTQGAGTQTCDGDGDGFVDLSANSIEVFRFWQHLELADFLVGNFTGTRASAVSNEHATLGENVPQAFMEGNGWSARGWATGSSYSGGTGERYNLQYNNSFEYGAFLDDELTHGAALTPAEAYNLDIKIDDGWPAQGDVIAYYWDDCTTSGNNTDTAGEYDVDNDDRLCGLIFRNAF